MRKWIAIAVEHSTTMRRHRATFAKAVAETQTAKSSEVSQYENGGREPNEKMTPPWGLKMTGVAIQGAKPVRPMRKTPVR